MGNGESVTITNYDETKILECLTNVKILFDHGHHLISEIVQSFPDISKKIYGKWNKLWPPYLYSKEIMLMSVIAEGTGNISVDIGRNYTIGIIYSIYYNTPQFLKSLLIMNSIPVKGDATDCIY